MLGAWVACIHCPAAIWTFKYCHFSNLAHHHNEVFNAKRKPWVLIQGFRIKN